MNDHTKPQFVAALKATLGTYGREVTSQTVGIWWAILAKHELGDVQAAMIAHQSDPDAGRFAPTPAHIIAKLQGNDGFPSADEAWAVALESMDEAATLAVSREIMAAKSIAETVMDWGDKYGARKAFVSAYEREVAQSRDQGRGHKWVLSQGHDASRREEGIDQAISQGRLLAPADREALRIGVNAPLQQRIERQGEMRRIGALPAPSDADAVPDAAPWTAPPPKAKKPQPRPIAQGAELEERRQVALKALEDMAENRKSA